MKEVKEKRKWKSRKRKNEKCGKDDEVKELEHATWVGEEYELKEICRGKWSERIREEDEIKELEEEEW